MCEAPTRTPRVGDYIEPDGWGHGDFLMTGYEEADCDWRCDFRLPCGGIGRGRKPRYLWGVNVTVTGRIVQRDGSYRCRIEFVGLT